MPLMLLETACIPSPASVSAANKLLSSLWQLGQQRLNASAGCSHQRARHQQLKRTRAPAAAAAGCSDCASDKHPGQGAVEEPMVHWTSTSGIRLFSTCMLACLLSDTCWCVVPHGWFQQLHHRRYRGPLLCVWGAAAWQGVVARPPAGCC